MRWINVCLFSKYKGVRVRVRVKIRKDWKLIERGRVVDVMSMEW